MCKRLQPAFPNTSSFFEVERNGMTLRDYFAAAAIQGILSTHQLATSATQHAEYAYEVADALLKERDKT